MEKETEIKLDWFMIGWATGMFCCAILFVLIYWNKGIC